MQNIQPIMKWFFIWKDNFLESKYLNQCPENLIKLRFIEKNAMYFTGRPFQEKVLDNVVIEGWSSPDMIWENAQLGEWRKTYIQKFPTVKVKERSTGYDKDDGKYQDMTIEYGDTTILTQHTPENRINKEWLKRKDTLITLEVVQNLLTGKPIQPMLTPEKLQKHYESVSKK